MAVLSQRMSFDHPMAKMPKGVTIKVLRIWLTRYVGEDVTIEEHAADKVFIVSSRDPLALARASILLDQVVEYGFPRRPFWTCQAIY